MLFYDDIVLRPPTKEEAEGLYELSTSDECWIKFNGPYFGYTRPSFEEFLNTTFKRISDGKDALAIEYNGRLVGTVTYYWEDKNSRWLEAGIVIFDSTLWNKGLGRKALIPWITAIFDSLIVERVGLTTWSGNPRMIQSALSIGFTLEGTLRKVRYHNGIYHDAIRLGVIRTEWESFLANKPLTRVPGILPSAE